MPLAAVLRDLRDFGRQRRSTDPTDPVVELASRAHAALMWLEADAVGDIEVAKQWLDEVYQRPSGARPLM